MRQEEAKAGNSLGTERSDTNEGSTMNFGFVEECETGEPELAKMYAAISGELEKAERLYWENPQECGIILRRVAEKICRVYNRHYEVGFGEETSLEEFLCYTDKDEHNVMVSRFLSVARKEQRERLNKLRVLGDDCIWGEDAPDLGMAFDDRMSQNAKRMMETMVETLKDMCTKINGRDDLGSVFFSEDKLPVQKRMDEGTAREKENEKESFLGRMRRKKNG